MFSRPCHCRGRFIPAGAGNTSLSATLPAIATVYPRWRGEHYRKESANGDRDGLSPLARGTLAAKQGSVTIQRFIPAGAGNTHATTTICIQIAVYPRWRGEHLASCDPLERADGLSPLARGTRRYVITLEDAIGFIPAGAGNTSGVKPGNNYYSVYPRWRGEHIQSAMLNSDSTGLSPLARGTH